VANLYCWASSLPVFNARAVDVRIRQAHHKFAHEVVIAVGFDRVYPFNFVQM
jgi:hypothetical protein